MRKPYCRFCVRAADVEPLLPDDVCVWRAVRCHQGDKPVQHAAAPHGGAVGGAALGDPLLEGG